MSKEEKKLNEGQQDPKDVTDVTLESTEHDPVEDQVLAAFGNLLEASQMIVDIYNTKGTGKVAKVVVEEEEVTIPKATSCMPVESYISKMLERFKASAKIRVNWYHDGKPTEDAKLINRLLVYINYFNHVNEDTTLIFDRPLEDITVINEFVDFLRPLSVRVNVLDRRGKNLIYPPRNAPNYQVKGLSYDEFENLQIRFRNILRKDADQDRTSLASAMKPMNIYDILDSVSVKSMCASYDKPYIPTVINEAVGELFIEGRYYLVTESQIIEDYIRDWLK